MSSSVPANPTIESYYTDANFDGKDYFLVKRNGGDDMDLCGEGELAFGALAAGAEDCSTTARHLPVQVGGKVRVVAGGSITAGTLCMSDANGEAVTATTGSYAFGQALDDLVDGEVGTFAWAPSYYKT